ncbi:MAG: nucleoside-diphosphate kinase [Bacteriovoracaceae bacterium]|nr:nucleoside-diphosphate kinase [Bacteriovoracaceae bacterium]
MAYEKTFAMIKPNATEKGVIGRIIDKYECEGFSFGKIEYTWITVADAREFYAEHKDRPFYNGLVEFMTSGPVVLMVLERENAIAYNREVMGATNPDDAATGTIRELWADSLEANSVHGSDSSVSAAREIEFFFPDYAADVAIAA